jgi:hypothetical protein
MELTEEEFVEYVETLHLQNITGRETPEAAFKSGIIAAYEEFKQLSLGTVVQAKPEVCDENGMTEEEVKTWKAWYEKYSPKHK